MFVLLFFGALVGNIVSPKGSCSSTNPPGSPSPDEDIDDKPAIVDMGGAFLFREVGEDVSICGANIMSSG